MTTRGLAIEPSQTKTFTFLTPDLISYLSQGYVSIYDGQNQIGTPVSGSGTITLGGTAQNLFGGTIPISGFEVSNPGTASLWISKSSEASPGGQDSIEIPPGAVYTTPTGYSPNHSVSIYGATTGQSFMAERW